MSLSEYLKKFDFKFEGYTQQVGGQVSDLVALVSSLAPERRRVMEIGFNAGHSAELFLGIEGVTLVSFDLGVHEYLKRGKEFIDQTFPGRHTLVIGNSKKTVPVYADTHPEPFDFIFIDGGHDIETARADLRNCRRLAHADTIVVLDDTIWRAGWERPWNLGPNEAWTEGLASGVIREMSRRDYCPGRGMSWGTYV